MNQIVKYTYGTSWHYNRFLFCWLLRYWIHWVKSYHSLLIYLEEGTSMAATKDLGWLYQGPLSFMWVISFHSPDVS